MALRTLRQSAVRLRRPISWIARGLGVALAACFLIVGYFWLTTDLPSADWLRARATIDNTRILDRRGHLLYQLPRPLSGRQTIIPLQAIPLALQHATIAIEDARFYSNRGIDLRAIARATWTNLSNGAASSGGSTITQQLARNILLNPRFAEQRTLERKLREMVLAIKLTMAYPKDDILGLYLNQTYYGGMSYGVEAAAWHFFGKPARDLSLAECALLAGLPQAPSRYDPLIAPQAARARQAQVLDAMVHAGFITVAHSISAQAEPLQFASDGVTMRAPHFVYYVINQLSALLGPDVVIRGGLTITTTLDTDLQDSAQSIVQRATSQLTTPPDGRPGHRVANGAAVVLDPADGAILVMVGSPNFDDSTIQGQVNGALALRQPGSAIKPLMYAAALEQGWTPATMILDVPSAFPTREGRPYAPQNYDRLYHGPLSLREALATSSNVAAVRTLNAIGVPALLDMAARLGISTLSRDSSQYGLALTLGGGEVTLLELTAAYGAFASGGRRVSPYAIVDVTDAQGRAVISFDHTGAQNTNVSNVSESLCASCLCGACPAVLSPQVAYLITDILSDRIARMRAFGVASPLELDRSAAVKTGTTTNWRDNWAVGYTSARVVGVWIGNADGQPMEDVSGLTGAAPIWHDLMIAAHRGIVPAPFDRPSGIVELPVCTEGGLLPSAGCPATRLERFIAGTQPTRPDDTHVVIRVDPERNCRAPNGDSAARGVPQRFWLLPPEAAPWAASAGVPQPPTQVCAVAGGAASAQAPGDPAPALDLGVSLAITSPAPGTVYTISPGVPREHQRIELRALAGADTISLIIQLDGAPVATLDRPPYRTLWQLTPGKHYVSVVARDSRGQIQSSSAVGFDVQQ